MLYDPYLTRKFTSRVCPLLALQDNKVVISQETSGVALGTDRSAKDNDVFGQGSMQNPHGAHSTASIVEYPFFLELNVAGVFLVQILGNVGNQCMAVVAILFNVAFRDLMKNMLIENVVAFLNLVETNEQRCKQRKHKQEL